MAEEAQTRVQKAFGRFMNDLDRQCLRKVQADMHRCATECCDRTDTSLEANQNCIQRCSEPMQMAQAFVEREVNQFQDRIERCVLSCQDKVKDKMTDKTSDAQMKAFTDQFQTCVVKCVDTHVELMPNMLKKMTQSIKSGTYQ